MNFRLQSISEGGRREREQVNTGSMVYYNHRVQAVQLYHFCNQKLEGEWSGNEASNNVAQFGKRQS